MGDYRSWDVKLLQIGRLRQVVAPDHHEAGGVNRGGTFVWSLPGHSGLFGIMYLMQPVSKEKAKIRKQGTETVIRAVGAGPSPSFPGCGSDQDHVHSNPAMAHTDTPRTFGQNLRSKALQPGPSPGKRRQPPAQMKVVMGMRKAAIGLARSPPTASPRPDRLTTMPAAHGFDLVLGTALAAGDDGTGMAHAAARRGGAARDEPGGGFPAALLLSRRSGTARPLPRR